MKQKWQWCGLAFLAGALLALGLFAHHATYHPESWTSRTAHDICRFFGADLTELREPRKVVPEEPVADDDTPAPGPASEPRRVPAFVEVVEVIEPITLEPPQIVVRPDSERDSRKWEIEFGGPIGLLPPVLPPLRMPFADEPEAPKGVVPGPLVFPVGWDMMMRLAFDSLPGHRVDSPWGRAASVVVESFRRAWAKQMRTGAEEESEVREVPPKDEVPPIYVPPHPDEYRHLEIPARRPVMPPAE